MENQKDVTFTHILESLSHKMNAYNVHDNASHSVCVMQRKEIHSNYSLTYKARSTQSQILYYQTIIVSFSFPHLST